jgi:hypothetical protein
MGDMFLRRDHPKEDIPVALVNLLLAASFAMARKAHEAFKVEARRRTRNGGGTLRPGEETPLWNELRRQLKPHLRKYGHQANLGRLLGLPRQRINAFVTGGGQMPDAERTLQLLIWLQAVRRGRRPS